MRLFVLMMFGTSGSARSLSPHGSFHLSQRRVDRYTEAAIQHRFVPELQVHLCARLIERYLHTISSLSKQMFSQVPPRTVSSENEYIDATKGAMHDDKARGCILVPQSATS